METVQVMMSDQWPIQVLPHREHAVRWEEWERPRLEFMHKTLTPGCTVFDIGSEEGEFSALYAKWGATVVPFEPDPHVWPNFKAVWESNGLISPPWAWFVGFAANRTVLRPPEIEREFLEPRCGGWPGCAVGREITLQHGFRNETERFHDTPSITIDDFSVMTGMYPDCLAIDVEGAELEVLFGAARILKERRPVLFISVHPAFIRDKYHYGAEQLHCFLRDLRYYDGKLLPSEHEEHWVFFPGPLSDER